MTGDITSTPVYQGGGLTLTSAQALVNKGLGKLMGSLIFISIILSHVVYKIFVLFIVYRSDAQLIVFQ